MGYSVWIMKVSKQFVTPITISSVWSFVADIRKIGSCLPDAQPLDGATESEAIIRMKFKIGFIRKTVDMKSKVIARDPRKNVTFESESTDVRVRGSLNLLEVDPNQTQLSYELDVTPLSAIAHTAVSLIGDGMIQDITVAFADRLKTKIESEHQTA